MTALEQELSFVHRKLDRLEMMICNTNGKIGLILEKFLSHRAGQISGIRSLLQVEEDICTALAAQLKLYVISNADNVNTNPSASNSNNEDTQGTSSQRRPDQGEGAGEGCLSLPFTIVSTESQSQSRRRRRRDQQDEGAHHPIPGLLQAHVNSFPLPLPENSNSGSGRGSILFSRAEVCGSSEAFHLESPEQLDVFVEPNNIKVEEFDVDADVDFESEQEQGPAAQDLESQLVNEHGQEQELQENGHFPLVPPMPAPHTSSPTPPKKRHRRRGGPGPKHYDWVRSYASENEARVEAREQWRMNATSQCSNGVKKIYYSCKHGARDNKSGGTCPVGMYLKVVEGVVTVDQFVSNEDHQHDPDARVPVSRPIRQPPPRDPLDSGSAGG